MPLHEHIKVPGSTALTGTAPAICRSDTAMVAQTSDRRLMRGRRKVLDVANSPDLRYLAWQPRRRLATFGGGARSPRRERWAFVTRQTAAAIRPLNSIACNSL
jgi:hypothetical protein